MRPAAGADDDLARPASRAQAAVRCSMPAIPSMSEADDLGAEGVVRVDPVLLLAESSARGRVVAASAGGLGVTWRAAGPTSTYWRRRRELLGEPAGSRASSIASARAALAGSCHGPGPTDMACYESASGRPARSTMSPSGAQGHRVPRGLFATRSRRALDRLHVGRPGEHARRRGRPPASAAAGARPPGPRAAGGGAACRATGRTCSDARAWGRTSPSARPRRRACPVFCAELARRSCSACSSARWSALAAVDVLLQDGDLHEDDAGEQAAHSTISIAGCRRHVVRPRAARGARGVRGGA